MNIRNVTHRDVQFIVAYVHPIINHVCSVCGSVKTRCHVIFHFDVGLDLLCRVCPPDNKA